MILTTKNLDEVINNYQTLYDKGFTGIELNQLLEKYSIDIDSFYEKLGVNTVAIIDGKIVTYHCDIIKGIRCVLENREQTLEEWD